MPVNKKPGIFISGKMRSVPYYGFPAFDKARDRLAGLGLTPLSPADMDRAAGFDPAKWNEDTLQVAEMVEWKDVPDTFDLAAAIARDNAAIDDPDTVAVYVIHEGISESAGGMAEIERGMKRGLVILYDTMSDGDILHALGIGVGRPTPPDNPNPSVSLRNARGMVMGQESLKANDPCATVFGKAGAAAMRAHIEKSLVDAANPAQTFFTDPVTGEAKDGRYTERGGVLDEAKSLICGDRNSQYGPPSQDFERTAGMMNALFGHMLQEGKAFKSRDVAWIMLMVKASRSQHAPKRDNYVDAAGYAACGWECESETQKKGDTRE